MGYPEEQVSVERAQELIDRAKDNDLFRTDITNEEIDWLMLHDDQAIRIAAQSAQRSREADRETEETLEKMRANFRDFTSPN